ncbi:MAG: hypothetical protein C4560_11360 [Nitrospiraceae bacterium]|nr:MAG: hypothetical protein C4560_11360 [Nitrospiraceae bacterium]
MTTVINFNFLNFFKLSNSHTAYNIRSYAQYSDNGRPDYAQKQEEIIDVTPYSRALSENKRPSFQLPDLRKETYLPAPSGVEKTYDHKGEIVQYTLEKGSHVNSYA